MGRQQGRKTETLFHETLLATAGGPTHTIAEDWHFKVKDIEYDSGLTKKYCITASMQKINSIRKLIFKINQILGSNELNYHGHFYHAHPKITEIAFSFPERAPTYKKSVHSI